MQDTLDIVDILEEVFEIIESRHHENRAPSIDWPVNFPSYLDDVLRHNDAVSKYNNESGPCPLDPLRADFKPFDRYCVSQMLTPLTADILKDVGDRITKLTGFECKYETIDHEIDEPEFVDTNDDNFTESVRETFRRISVKLGNNTVKVQWKTWWCPQLKLAFYAPGMFYLPPEYHWMYTDVKPGSSYGRRHCEYQLIRERIRIDEKIMMFEVPTSYCGWNVDNRAKFVDGVMHHYTHKMPFIGGVHSVAP